MHSVHKYGHDIQRARMTDTLHTIGDYIAAAVTIATILKLLPAIAALLSIAWTITRFYDRRSDRKAMDVGSSVTADRTSRCSSD